MHYAKVGLKLMKWEIVNREEIAEGVSQGELSA